MPYELQYSQTSLIRSSFIRIPRHPEENRWLPMCSIMLCIQHNRTSRSAYRCMILCTDWLKCEQKASSYPVACGLQKLESGSCTRQMRSLTCWVHVDSTVACTCHFSRLFYILCTLVVLHRTRLQVCTMSLLLTCHMHIQHVCSVIRFPHLSGYFCGKQMCAVKRGLTVH